MRTTLTAFIVFVMTLVACDGDGTTETTPEATVTVGAQAESPAAVSPAQSLLSFAAPVEGDLDTDCSGRGWCFNQHGEMQGAIGHGPGGGIGGADESFEWDANLPIP